MSRPSFVFYLASSSNNFVSAFLACYSRAALLDKSLDRMSLGFSFSFNGDFWQLARYDGCRSCSFEVDLFVGVPVNGCAEATVNGERKVPVKK